MSKYRRLWEHLQMDGSAILRLTFEELKDILGFELDHSFLTYKKESVRFGYQVFTISMRKKHVIFLKCGWTGQLMSFRLPW